MDPSSKQNRLTVEVEFRDYFDKRKITDMMSNIEGMINSEAFGRGLAGYTISGNGLTRSVDIDEDFEKHNANYDDESSTYSSDRYNHYPY